MNTEEDQKITMSVRLEHLDVLDKIIRDFGIKNRGHFFQLCTDALLQAYRDGARRLDWPPRFVIRDD